METNKTKEQILEEEFNSTKLVSQLKIENLTPTQYAIVMRAMEKYARQEKDSEPKLDEPKFEPESEATDFVKKSTDIVEGWISKIKKKTEDIQKEIHNAIDEIETLIKKKN